MQMNTKTKFDNFSLKEMQDILDTSSSYREVLNKIGYKHSGNNNETLKKYISTHNLNMTQFMLNAKKSKKRVLTRYSTKESFINALNNDLITWSSYAICRRLIDFNIKPNKCENCNRSKWLGKDIPLELHHIDTNHKNNHLDNLLVVCPNCHSYLHKLSKNKTKKVKYSSTVNINVLNNTSKTSKTKKTNENINFCKTCGVQISKGANHCKHCAGIINNKDKTKKPTPFGLISKIKEYNMNFCAIGRYYGVSDNAIRKWCKSYKIPTNKKELKKYINKRINTNIGNYI